MMLPGTNVGASEVTGNSHCNSAQHILFILRRAALVAGWIIASLMSGIVFLIIFGVAAQVFGSHLVGEIALCSGVVGLLLPAFLRKLANRRRMRRMSQTTAPAISMPQYDINTTIVPIQSGQEIGGTKGTRTSGISHIAETATFPSHVFRYDVASTIATGLQERRFTLSVNRGLSALSFWRSARGDLRPTSEKVRARLNATQTRLVVGCLILFADIIIGLYVQVFEPSKGPAFQHVFMVIALVAGVIALVYRRTWIGEDCFANGGEFEVLVRQMSKIRRALNAKLGSKG